MAGRKHLNDIRIGSASGKEKNPAWPFTKQRSRVLFCDWGLVEVPFDDLYYLGEVNLEALERLQNGHALRRPAPSLVDGVK